MALPAERRIRLTLHYDGSGFFGWQLQPGVRTAQGELETALSRLTDRPTRTTAAGRTDRGVHATGQVASALVPARWEATSLRRALNAILPPDLWIARAEEVPLDFHARFDAVARSYVYRVGTADRARSPLHRRWCWPLGASLDRSILDGCAAALPGDRSLEAFAKRGQSERGYRCRVLTAAWRSWGELGLDFRITANRFLHHTVRYLVGTMVEAARGRRPAGDFGKLLAGEAGLETSAPAPPEGLFLTRVHYPNPLASGARPRGQRPESDPDSPTNESHPEE